MAVERSDNSKLGGASTTYASQPSCPSACPFINNGCYAQAAGPLGWMTRRMNTAALESGADVLDVALAEAAAIRTLTGTRPLRLHTYGDCPTEESARIVSGASAEYAARHGSPVWTYTHAWRTVVRSAWNRAVSVLASCETVKAARKAMDRGYAAAIVVPEHTSPNAYRVDDVTVIPCPEQTGKSASCATCRLCWDSDALLRRRAVIAFETHGSGARKAAAAVERANR
jgi:hypothetical protein